MENNRVTFPHLLQTNNNLFLLSTEFQETLESVSRHQPRERRNIARRLAYYLYSKSARKSTRNFHKRVPQLISSVKQVKRDLREKKVPLGTPDTREKKEHLGKLARVVFWALKELKESEEHKGPRERKDSRE